MNEQQYLNYISNRFRRAFDESYTPQWHCPSCDNGTLKLKPDSLDYYETGESISRHGDPDWDSDSIEYRFSARFECNTCLELTTCIGKGVETVYCDSSTEVDEVIYVDEFMPLFFSPPVPLSQIPKKCPDSVRRAITSAFQIAWADYPAAANRLRVAIEKLVDEVAPQNSGLSKLHAKIEALKETHAEQYELLMAVKWLGNNASHDDNLQEYDLAYGFKILDLVLKELYLYDKEGLVQMAKEVIKNKGRINF